MLVSENFLIGGDEFLVNLLHLCETMTTRWIEESELKVPIETLEKFALRNNFDIKYKRKNNQLRYHLIRKRILVHFISGKDTTSFNFLDISDLHIGHPNFDEKKLREVLHRAIIENVEYVFIAGDIFEGITDDSSENTPYMSQIDLARSIFHDYNLKYYAINGNHDYSFEQLGLPNPIKRLETMLLSDGIEFHFFDTYLIDFVICGVIKRVMHVERQDFNKKSIFATLKLRKFDEEQMLQNYYDDESYPVRFFQVGHIHVNVQMYFSKRRIYISQSGSFIKNDSLAERANFIKGEVIGKKILLS